MIEMNANPAWILARAVEEDNGIVSVGGLLTAQARAEAGSEKVSDGPDVESKGRRAIAGRILSEIETPSDHLAARG